MRSWPYSTSRYLSIVYIKEGDHEQVLGKNMLSFSMPEKQNIVYTGSLASRLLTRNELLRVVSIISIDILVYKLHCTRKAVSWPVNLWIQRNFRDYTV